MSESLTTQEIDRLESAAKEGWSTAYSDILKLASMARRCLSAEERLERAVEALKEAEAGLEFSGAESMKDVGNFVKAPKKALLFVRNVLAELGRPKAIHPPAPVKPPHGTDALRDEEHDPTLEAMRKGLDDHSCNTTGWEK